MDPTRANQNRGGRPEGVRFRSRYLLLPMALLGAITLSFASGDGSVTINGQNAGPTPFPTDPDPVGDARAAAESFFRNAHLGAPTAVVPVLRQYVESEDMLIRWHAMLVVQLIMHDETSISSGLAAAVSSDPGIQDALFAAIEYYGPGQYGTEARVAAILALSVVMPNPSNEVEEALTRQYWREFTEDGLYVIVGTLAVRRCASPEAIRVYQDAAADRFIPELAELAQKTLDSMNAW